VTWTVYLDDHPTLVGISIRELNSTLCFISMKGAVPASYSIRYLERFGPRTSQQQVAVRAKELIQKLTLHKDDPPAWRMVVDITLGGRPLVDMLRRMDLDPTVVTVTTGYESNQVSLREYRTPTRDITSTFLLLLDSKRLRISDKLPLAPDLISMMTQVDVSQMQVDVDLLMAPGVALTYAERYVIAYPKESKPSKPFRRRRILGELV
jgi:hypothetical protein